MDETTEKPFDEVDYWNRPNITKQEFARLRAIALNLANLVDRRLPHIAGELKELREILLKRVPSARGNE